MKKMKYWNRMLAAVLAASMLAGCGASTTPQATTAAVTEANADDQKTSAAAEETTAAETAQATEAAAETTAAAEKTEETSAAEVLTIGEASDEVLRVGSLKGPTTMGLVNLMSEVESGAKSGYSFEMQSQPDVIMSELVAGKLDIALLPANVAAVAYNKTNHGVSAIDINTLGVLYCVTGDENVKSVKDLAGKTVLSTGQGASPEYVLNYLLEKNGVTDCDVQFKSEATEIAALLKQDPAQIAILPQPFVTVATAQNDQLKVAFSLTDEWKSVSPDSKLLTGVTVVRNEVLENRAAEVDQFIADHQASTEKTDLAGYLQVLFDANPKSVGGTMPEDDFYYIQK